MSVPEPPKGAWKSPVTGLSLQSPWIPGTVEPDRQFTPCWDHPPSRSHCLLGADHPFKWYRLLQGHLVSLNWEYDQPNQSQFWQDCLIIQYFHLLSPILHILKLIAPADILPSWLKSCPLYIIALFAFFGIFFFWHGQTWHIVRPWSQVSGPRLWLQLRIQEVVQTSGKINSKKSTTGLITIKFLEIKDKQLLKAATEKWHIMYRRKTIQITIAFSSEATEVMKRRCNASQVLKAKQRQTTILQPAKISFKNQEWGKPLKDEEKLTRFVTNRSKSMNSYMKCCEKKGNVGAPGRKPESATYKGKINGHSSLSFLNVFDYWSKIILLSETVLKLGTQNV